MSTRTPEPPPLPAELERLLHRLRLPYLRRMAPEVCATARAQRWDPAEILRVLLLEEVHGRDQATREMHKRAAGFPAGKSLESWGEERSSIPPAAQRALLTLEWVGRGENLVVHGPSGTGKSHLCEALGELAVDTVAKENGLAWCTTMDAVRHYGQPLVDDPPACFSSPVV